MTAFLQAESISPSPQAACASPLRKKAAEVSGVIEGEEFTAPPPAESSLRFLNQQLSKLANALDSADAAPTADARASWARLKPLADAALAAWAGVNGEAPTVPK